MFNKLKTALSNRKDKISTNENLETLTLKLTGMHCSSCAINIDLALEDFAGIKSIKTHYPSSTTVIKFDPETISIDLITLTLKNLGYTALS